MNATTLNTQLATVTGRIASATSAIRARGIDAVRYQENGGTSDALIARLEVTVERLEKVAADLEASLR